MYQQNRGDYRKNESLFSEFSHSCLGRAVFAAIIIVVIATVAIMTRPSEEYMYNEMTDNIIECLQKRDSIDTDWIDDAVNNIGYMLTTADTTNIPDEMEVFNKQNTMVYHDHTLYATMRLYNNFHVEGERCGIGLFGIVIPTVNFNDFISRGGTMRRDYNQPVKVNNTNDDSYEDFGENPDLGGVFEYEGD